MVNEHYLYLLLNLGSVLFPVLFSFYPKANFSREWKFLFPALLITAGIFIVWDEAFTQWHIWGFNHRYITGVFIGSLPLEEILFFLLIPYACLFVYFSSTYLIKPDVVGRSSTYIDQVLIGTSLVMGVWYIDRRYTAVTFLALAVLLAFHHWYWKSAYMGRFYLAYGIILIPFLVVNGVLTGSWIAEEIVWYNDSENLGYRVGTIPLDDFFYNMLMLLSVTTLYERFKANSKRKGVV